MEYNKKYCSRKIILQLKFSGVVCMGQARTRENFDLYGTVIVPNNPPGFFLMVDFGGLQDCNKNPAVWFKPAGFLLAVIIGIIWPPFRQQVYSGRSRKPGMHPGTALLLCIQPL